MPAVLIHPSGGPGRGKINWSKTLDQTVDFMSDEHVQFLSPDQRQDLLALHPEGRARFWGTFDEEWREGYLREAGSGGTVIFTSENHVRGIGVIGGIFKNPAFADTLWAPDPDKGSYACVYSLVSFEHVEIPYAEARVMLGTSPKYPFRSIAVVRTGDAEVFGSAVAEAVTQPSRVPPVGASNGAAPTGREAPARSAVTAQRIVRDGAVARWVKNIHSNRCQICDIALTTIKGPYSEGAHIQALGGGHGGPDRPSNLLCLCPNDHVLFDGGALYIQDGHVYRTEGKSLVGPLRTHDHHELDWRYADYHREHVARVTD